MKIENKTNYRTSDLRKFIRAIIVEAGMNPADKWKISVTSARKKYVSGYAYYNSRVINLHIPDIVCMYRLAQVLHHEIDHCRGEHHRDMISLREIATSAWEGLVLRKKSKKQLPVKDMVTNRYEHAKKMVELWTRKTKRAETRLKKWGRKLKYYEQKVIAAAHGKN